MSQKQSKQAAQKQEELSNFKQTIEKLAQESQEEAQREAIKRAQAKEISNFQLTQAADRAKQNLKEEQYFKEKQEQQWPFRTEDQVKQEQHRINSDFREGLDQQMTASGKALGLSSGRNTSMARKMRSTKLRSQMTSTHNVFPKFLNPEKKVHMAHFTPAELYQVRHRLTNTSCYFAFCRLQ